MKFPQMNDAQKKNDMNSQDTNERLLGTRNPEARELSPAEFMRAARMLQFTERELQTLKALYRDKITDEPIEES